MAGALLSHIPSQSKNMAIVATFDKDPNKAGRVIQGCHCYPLEMLNQVFREKSILLGILAVPAPEAQGVADLMVRAGARGIVNFARVALRVPMNVYVENIDMTMSLEKVAFFARQKREEKEVES